MLSLSVVFWTIKYNVIYVLDNANIEEKTYSNGNGLALKNGDSVYITTFINVHNFFVRKVEDDTDELYNFIENVNMYCAAGNYFSYFSVHQT